MTVKLSAGIHIKGNEVIVAVPSGSDVRIIPFLFSEYCDLSNPAVLVARLHGVNQKLKERYAIEIGPCTLAVPTTWSLPGWFILEAIALESGLDVKRIFSDLSSAGLWHTFQTIGPPGYFMVKDVANGVLGLFRLETGLCELRHLTVDPMGCQEVKIDHLLAGVTHEFFAEGHFIKI